MYKCLFVVDERLFEDRKFSEYEIDVKGFVVGVVWIELWDRE